MKTQPFEVRSIHNDQEFDQVMRILDRAFPVGKSFFMDRLSNDSAYDTSTTWIAKQEDAVTSTIQVFPVYCRLENALIKIGGIGSVATDEAYRGQGHCQEILKKASSWMVDEQYDLSLLYAVITPFYEKFGWNVVPQPLYELTTAQLAAAQEKIKHSATQTSDLQLQYTIIPYEDHYHADLANIYEQFNVNRTFTAKRSGSSWTDRIHWPRWKDAEKLLVLHDGNVVAYGLISPANNEQSYHIDELCYLPGHEGAVLPLLQALVKTRHGLEHLAAYLPDDHALADIILAAGGSYTLNQDAMWKVLRFVPLLVKIREILQRRLNNSYNSRHSLNIHLSCAGQHAYLQYANGELEITNIGQQGQHYIDITLSQTLFVGSLLQGFDQIVSLEHSRVIDEQNGNRQQDGDFSAPLTDEARTILQALFPKQASTYYNMDRF
ncbi:GNAT family N-acetyltransferase [Paenibacillus solani]|uniref:GNAT family N-acetyltransferase n=1 Tax=Paenibacillus solani TaxID=1705565 RepID=UPI003D2B9AB5